MESLTSEISTVWPTLLSCYEPVEQYRQLTAGQLATQPAPAEFNALDAYLLWQLAATLPTAPDILDLSANATQGASAAFWLASPSIHQYFAPPDAQTTASAVWRTQFPAASAELGISRSETTTGDLASVVQQRSAHLPLLIMFAAHEIEASLLSTKLDEVLQHFPQGWIFLWPLGELGNSAVLAAALNFCQTQPRYRLTALRESSPFLAASTLGLIYPAADAALPLVLTRLQQAYGGNYEFLARARLVTQLALEAGQLEGRYAAAQRELARTEKERQEAQALAHSLNQQLVDLTNSKAWRVVERARRLARTFLP